MLSADLVVVLFHHGLLLSLLVQCLITILINLSWVPLLSCLLLWSLILHIPVGLAEERILCVKLKVLMSPNYFTHQIILFLL